MKTILIEELKRIHEIMGTSSKLIVEDAGGPGPIARFFEKLGVKSESEFQDLRKKLFNGQATDEERLLYNTTEDIMYNTGKSFEEVLQNNSDEILETLMKNPDFIQLGRKVWMDLNPSFEKVYNQIENIPNIEKFTPENLDKWLTDKQKTIYDLDVPELVKKDMLQTLSEKYKKELPKIEQRFVDLVNDIKLQISEFSDYIKTTESYFKLSPAEKIKFDDNLKKVKDLLNLKITKDNPKLEEELKLLVKQYQALDKNAIQKLAKLGGDKWATYSTTKKAVIALILIVTFPSLSYLAGYGLGILDLKKAKEEIEKGMSDASGTSPTTPTTPTTEPTTPTTTEPEFKTWWDGKGYADYDTGSFTVDGLNVTVKVDGEAFGPYTKQTDNTFK
jgi:hypothetical protein